MAGSLPFISLTALVRSLYGILPLLLAYFQQCYFSSNVYHLFNEIRLVSGEFSCLRHDAQYCEWWSVKYIIHTHQGKFQFSVTSIAFYLVQILRSYRYVSYSMNYLGASYHLIYMFIYRNSIDKVMDYLGASYHLIYMFIFRNSIDKVMDKTSNARNLYPTLHKI